MKDGQQHLAVGLGSGFVIFKAFVAEYVSPCYYTAGEQATVCAADNQDSKKSIGAFSQGITLVQGLLKSFITAVCIPYEVHSTVLIPPGGLVDEMHLHWLLKPYYSAFT